MPDIITRALLESKGIPTRDIVAAIWGRKLSGGYEPAEATGTLPLTFRSNGTALLDYRIYGNTVETQGVGVRTENLFDPNAAEEDGDKIISDFMPLDPSELVLTMAFDIPLRASYNYEITYYDSTKTAISFVGGMGEAYKTRETVKLNRQSEAATAAYVKVTLPKDLTNVLIQNGSTSGEYIPYGYKMQMVSRSGTRRTETPIYIGDTQLMQEEYVSYGKQKVYKRTENIFNGQIEQGYYAFADGHKDSTSVIAQKWVCTTLTACNGNTEYGIRAELSNGLSSRNYGAVWFDSSQRFISSNSFSTLANPVVFYLISPSSAKYFVINIAGTTTDTVMRPSNINNITIAESSAAPSEYIPYYNPQDPPVPLPKLPTFSGTNTVLDYEETPAPEEVWVKYQKGD